MKFLVRSPLLIYFFLISCDQSSEIGIEELLTDQKEKIKVHYIDIPLEVKNIYYDSVRTDDGELYFGKIDDPIFGKTKAIGYAQSFYQEGSEIPPIPGEYSENYYIPNDSSEFDSAVIYLHLSKVFGSNEIDEQEIFVKQIADTLFSSALYTSNKYTPITTEERGIIGLSRFKTANLNNNILSITLKEGYGKFILNEIIKRTKNYKLLDKMRGFALEPGENNNQLISFDLDNDNSKLIVYFKNPVDFPEINSPMMDSLQYTFRFNTPQTKHYTYYENNRSTSELSAVESFDDEEEFILNDKIYWQSSSGIYPIINLNNFQSFLDTAKNIVLNKVQIVTGPVNETFHNLAPKKSFYYIANSNNKINPIGIISNPNENVIMRDNSYFTEDNDQGEYLFDENITFTYQGQSTVFFQELASGNINAKKLVAYPENPNSFEKLVIDKNRFYLKVYYTKFNQ